MPITMTQHAPGMPREVYDQTIANIGEPLRQSGGFISHAAQVTADGVTVTEVWETREQWQQWFDTSVRPHLPPGAPEPTVTELHNALGTAQ
jgi:heme-degrading monooxygenase HmoA